jgi:hypothetical protein
MKILPLALGVLVITVAIGTRADAQNYPWCAIYSAKGAQNCGMVSFQQCMDTVRGIGGFCEPNEQYVPRAAVAHPLRKRHS